MDNEKDKLSQDQTQKNRIKINKYVFAELYDDDKKVRVVNEKEGTFVSLKVDTLFKTAQKVKDRQ